MILDLKLFKFIFRHKWDKTSKQRYSPMFKTYELGI